MPVPTSWHPGEIAAQEARGFEDEVWGAYEGYQEGAPDWMELFLSQLPFLSVTTLDAQGRPWASLVANDGSTGFIQAVPSEHGANRLRFTIQAREGVPIREALFRLHSEFKSGKSAFDSSGEPHTPFQMAAVGIMLHNRRRNKMEGVIVDVKRVPANDDDDKFIFDVAASNTFGNCPKYINIRFLMPAKSDAASATTSSTRKGLKPTRGNGDLPQDVLEAIQGTDLLFLATKYSGNDPASYLPDPARLGNNHRGGPPGFLRTYIDEQCSSQRCIVLPDWSGNRLMMSFGNMTKDPCAGITIPVFSAEPGVPSSVLHLTCRAQVLAAKEAQEMMRGVQGAVKLWIEEWTIVSRGLPVVVAAAQDHGQLIGFSPYNPPVRRLKNETKQVAASEDRQSASAKMIDVSFYSEEIARFTFEVKQGSHIFANYRPGMHIVMDCYDMMDTRIKMYAHMASFRGGEKDLNDDGVRSWTVTHATPVHASQSSPEEGATWRFDLTLRRKNRGGVTPCLFRIGKLMRQCLDASDGTDAGSGYNPAIPILGLDGSAFLPEKANEIPLRLLYLTSGIGLTPLLAHLSQLKQGAHVTAIVATRMNEALVTQQLIADALLGVDIEQSESIDIDVHLLVSTKPAENSDGQSLSALGDQVPDVKSRLPSNVRFSVVMSHGKRLANSLWGVGAAADADVQAQDTRFTLPPSVVKILQSAPLDMALICAGSAFASTAQAAIKEAPFTCKQVHVESFSF